MLFQRQSFYIPRELEYHEKSNLFFDVRWVDRYGQRAWRAHSVQVLGIEGDTLSNLTAFMHPLAPALVPAFGLPLAFED